MPLFLMQISLSRVPHKIRIRITPTDAITAAAMEVVAVMETAVSKAVRTAMAAMVAAMAVAEIKMETATTRTHVLVPDTSRMTNGRT